ncbi:YwqI/YxiC family protein [Bacillus swezeyi]|uniref:YwqI/YxiC family protein n=1 Tax=Bacillus swezeyi TaxID=1925020 RepID=A0A1R1QV40_9BACI|nr:YwqI/YxiC family protein [Bacillus swezeyi]MEC1260097.1 YwqI/YxiC family protein [Bacillus swezeyi]MED1738791.1 YwqI/YxiC family protein [Bacillus swezeyi]MED2927014.1 YwqI/YxiC family protein [Bacillus swezeyi]MED2942627.1 YwqI/YxiC family protein [Bacillus swezeyi]MED2964882.1 YwqI/YxiC family protein [Bacillus swezeyi]
MSQEIKVKTGEVKHALSKLKHSAEGIKSSVPTDISGKNHLDVVKKIEEMNKDLKELAETYASALSKQIAQTESAVETMKDTDKKLASSIKSK